MKKQILLSVAGLLLAFSAPAQQEPSEGYRNFPLVVTLQFHSLSLPFRDFKTNFSNIGLGVGTEFSYNGRQNWVQQFNAVWYRNKVVGNGLLFYSQAAWRPSIASHYYPELKIGAGYLYSFRPVESYRQRDGAWVSAGHKGKGMFTIPIGVSAGYTPPSFKNDFSLFASYQFLLVTGYNESIPFVPETLFQVGSRIHLKQD